jgi:transposase
MAKTRRSFTREFKIEAVKLVTEKGQSITEAARSLGIHENQLRTWKKALEQQSQGEQQAFPGHGNRPALEEEIRQLRAENRRLHLERDLLKKATAFFAREAM